MLQAEVCPVFQMNCPIKSNLLNVKEKHQYFQYNWSVSQVSSGAATLAGTHYPSTSAARFYGLMQLPARRHLLMRVHMQLPSCTRVQATQACLSAA